MVGALAILAFAMPTRARGESNDPAAGAGTSSVAKTPAGSVASTPQSADGQMAAAGPLDASPAKPLLKQKVKALVSKIAPDRLKRDREFKTAAAQFPEFCHHWEQNLRDRETNNLQKLAFAIKDGFETATYTGYGKVSGCESHQSKDGYSIGKVTYEEFVYYLVGKTPDEARHAAPRPISDTHTTEIFRWEKSKWFY